MEGPAERPPGARTRTEHRQATGGQHRAAAGRRGTARGNRMPRLGAQGPTRPSIQASCAGARGQGGQRHGEGDRTRQWVGGSLSPPVLRAPQFYYASGKFPSRPRGSLRWASVWVLAPGTQEPRAPVPRTPQATQTLARAFPVPMPCEHTHTHMEAWQKATLRPPRHPKRPLLRHSPVPSRSDRTRGMPEAARVATLPRHQGD